MSKQGNRRLRLALYQVAFSSIRKNKALRAYYYRKLKGDAKTPGKKPKVALGHVMKKVLVILWTCWKNNELYDADRMAGSA